MCYKSILVIGSETSIIRMCQLGGSVRVEKSQRQRQPNNGCCHLNSNGLLTLLPSYLPCVSGSTVVALTNVSSVRPVNDF